MIQVTPQMGNPVACLCVARRQAVEPADFRKKIDGLPRVCREALKRDPMCV